MAANRSQCMRSEPRRVRASEFADHVTWLSGVSVDDVRQSDSARAHRLPHSKAFPIASGNCR